MSNRKYNTSSTTPRSGYPSSSTAQGIGIGGHVAGIAEELFLEKLEIILKKLDRLERLFLIEPESKEVQ